MTTAFDECNCVNSLTCLCSIEPLLMALSSLPLYGIYNLEASAVVRG